MYAVYDVNENLIAFHEEYDVCDIYVSNVYSSNKISLHIKKIKKKNRYVLEDKDELYLIRYGKTYIQEGYLTYLELMDNQLFLDIRYARDIIYRIIECCDIKEKERKDLKKSALILEKLYDEDASFTPDLCFLKKVKMDYDPYIYNIRL